MQIDQEINVDVVNTDEDLGDGAADLLGLVRTEQHGAIDEVQDRESLNAGAEGPTATMARHRNCEALTPEELKQLELLLDP